MVREFVFLENESEWPKEVRELVNREEHDEMFKFGLNNLNSTEDASSRNCSEVSNILGPFNSTLSEKNETDSPRKMNLLDSKVPMVDQYEFINWKAKARQANILYLRNFNGSVDLGINLAVAMASNGSLDAQDLNSPSPH
jgi:hypothetical protein